jgi:nicotinic acid phosphoribosyltransferase
MTKIITAGIIIVVLYVAWHLFVYWEQVRDEKETQAAAAKVVVNEHALGGMPHQLENSLQGAKSAGVNTFRQWLDTYRSSLQDPRKAWIELDYCVMLSRDNPKEARRIFTAVKERIRPDSPVYPRVKQLEPTYDP